MTSLLVNGQYRGGNGLGTRLERSGNESASLWDGCESLMHLCFCDVEELLKNHGDALVPQETGHCPNVDGANKTLI